MWNQLISSPSALYPFFFSPFEWHFLPIDFELGFWNSIKDSLQWALWKHFRLVKSHSTAFFFCFLWNRSIDRSIAKTTFTLTLTSVFAIHLWPGIDWFCETFRDWPIKPAFVCPHRPRFNLIPLIKSTFDSYQTRTFTSTGSRDWPTGNQGEQSEWLASCLFFQLINTLYLLSFCPADANTVSSKFLCSSFVRLFPLCKSQ